MKKTEKAHLMALFCLVILPHLGKAQSTVPVFSAPVDTTSSSSRYVASIRVSQFKKIVGAQFTLTWDPAILAFDSVGQFGLPLSLVNNFGLQSANTGVLRFAWSDEGLKGMDLKDEATLFSLFFRPIGALNARSPILFSDVPTAMEVVDVSYTSIKAEFRNGSVTIGQQVSTSTQSNQPEWLDIRAAFPNPLRQGESLQVEFYLKTAQPVQFAILDAQGKIYSEQQRDFASGVHRFEVASRLFPVPGIYFIRLNQGDRFSTQKILVR